MPSRKNGGQRPARDAPRRSLPWSSILLIAVVLSALAGATVLLLRPSDEVATARVSAGEGGTQPTVQAASRPADPATGGMVPVSAVNGVVTLPAADLSDGRARFYTYQSNGKTIPFFLLKGSDGVVRAAYDACDVCYVAKKGYHQEGDVMVCNNCGSRFPSVRINIETGGCNPSPLNRQVQDGNVIIKAADIEAGARYF